MKVRYLAFGAVELIAETDEEGRILREMYDKGATPVARDRNTIIIAPKR